MASKNIQRRGVKMIKKILSLLFFLYSFNSTAAVRCENLLTAVSQPGQISKDRLTEKIQRLQSYHKENTFFKLAPKDVDSYISDIERLAESVIRHNYKKIYKNLAVPKNLDLRLADDHILESGYHLFLFSANGRMFQIRSNGKVAFLHESWRFRLNNQTQHYTMAYIKNGRVHNDNQTEFILSTFANQFYLSRDMGRKERNRWLNGEDFFADGLFGQKVHFGVHYFRFKDYQPYLVQFTRDELIDSYLQNAMEINSYDHISDNRKYKLVPHEMDLELEVVFIGNTGIDFLKPKLREALKQDVLGF